MKSKDNSYNKIGFYFFLGTMAFSSIWAMYYLLINNTVELSEISTSSQAANPAIEALTEQEQEKPWVQAESLVNYGSKIYKAQCALCHGDKGLGNGTPGLIPPPRNLVEGRWKRGGSSKALFITLQKGIPGGSMVSFKHLPKVDRWALVHYVRSITKNKVPDNLTELESFGQKAL
ncbi:MAG: c-type cytochrome [Bdellovibrionales bacterium]